MSDESNGAVNSPEPLASSGSVADSDQIQIELEPASAASVFGDRLDLARRYTAKLAADSDTLGLLGPRELSKIWNRHVLNSASVAELVPAGARVADVGSGAGLPGIPMAIAQPGATFTLIEPMERRANWLSMVCRELGLQNVTVLRARAEEVQLSDFDIATARAVAPLQKLLRLMTPLIRNAESGTILAMKGERAASEIVDAAQLIKKLGFSTPEVVTVGLGIIAEPATVVKARLLSREER